MTWVTERCRQMCGRATRRQPAPGRPWFAAVVGVDGSEESPAALYRAAGQARLLHASLRTASSRHSANASASPYNPSCTGTRALGPGCQRCAGVRGSRGRRGGRWRSRTTSASSAALSTTVTTIAMASRIAKRSQNSGVRLVPTVLTLPRRVPSPCASSQRPRRARRRGRTARAPAPPGRAVRPVAGTERPVARARRPPPRWRRQDRSRPRRTPWTPARTPFAT